jgi:phage terminase large subunit-like protein
MEWGEAALKAYDEFRADLIVFEDNESPNRPSTVRDVIRTLMAKRTVKWQAVHASRDKRARADPVSALYQQGKVHHLTEKEDPQHPQHLPHHLAGLEYEMTTWDPNTRMSPNRLDALVHGLSFLMLQPQATTTASPSGVPKGGGSDWRF